MCHKNRNSGNTCQEPNIKRILFTIYRGMSNAEHKSQNYGISWTLSEDVAKQYIYFNKNNVQKGNGRLASIHTSKDSIITVFSVHGEIEIIYLD